MKSNWMKILKLRKLEFLLTAAAFVVGVVHTVKTAALSEELEKQINQESEEEETEK